MIQLPDSLAAWESENFDNVFKQEVSQLSVEQLPLQQALRFGNMVIPEPCTVMINRRQLEQQTILVDAGIFFSSIIAGCNCSDDPTPVDSQNEYCEIQFRINTENANTEVSLLA